MKDFVAAWKKTYRPYSTTDFFAVGACDAMAAIVPVCRAQASRHPISEFIALAKNEPSKINYGSAGVGSIHHMTVAIFADGLLTRDPSGLVGQPQRQALIESDRLRGYCISVLT